jgi:integrase
MAEVSTLAQVLDFAKVAPNPARDDDVRLPANDTEEVNPPIADHVAAVYGAIAPAYRLPVLVLDATGMRVGELERLRWGDVDERAGRWRVSKASAKTRKGRWVPVPEIVLGRVLDAVPREDRNLDGQVIAGFDADAFRTALGRACKAAGTPAFSPHDLRHRRATLWHLAGVPVAEAAGWLGHSSAGAPQDVRARRARPLRGRLSEPHGCSGGATPGAIPEGRNHPLAGVF